MKQPATDLRRRAERQLREQPAKTKRDDRADTQRMLQELQIHQIELELQNEELKLTKAEVDAGLEKFTDLYDFAPVGYFTLTADGTIQLVNLTGTSMVGVQRSRLVGQRFGLLLAPALRAVFKIFLKQVFEGDARHSADFEVLRPDQPPLTVNIEAKRQINDVECHAVVVDITERKQAEGRVVVSEVRYRRLFEAAQDGVLLLDPGTRKITDSNPFMTKLLGYSHDELVGKELFEIGLLKDAAASKKMFLELRRKHQVRYEDLPLESETGRHQEVEVVANLYEENGQPVIQCNIRDITVRKQAEMALVRLASIVESSDDAIIGKDVNGVVTSWNHGAEKIFGYAAREMIGTSITRLIPADRQEEESFILAKIRSGGSVQHFETLRQTKDGRLINTSITVSPIKEVTGKIIGVSKVARDITDRKRVEDILRRNEALFSALLSQAPIGLYLVDEQMRLIQVNPKALPVFKNVRPLLGRDFSEVIHLIWPKRVADQVAARFRHTLKTGEPYQSPEFVERRKDTQVKEAYEWQIQRVILPSGEHRVVCFFSDITERKRAEETQRRVELLAASNAKLKKEIIHRQAVEAALKKSEQHALELLKKSRQLQKKLRQMSHQNLLDLENQRKEISHELHDKISQVLIGINVQLAVFTRTAAVDPRAIAPVRELVEKSVKIVHDYARELRPAMLDQLGLIPALRTYLDEIPKCKGQKIHFTADAGVEALDNDKRTVLYRVAQEALVNVAKHARAHDVNVILKKIRGYVRLEIIDDGKAFEVERLSSVEWSNRLGLTGMRERVEMIGGRFSVKSTLGKGTTICAEIPIGKSRERKV